MSEAQETWDRLLIECWRDDHQFWALLKQFVREAAPILEKLNSNKRNLGYLVSLDLERTPREDSRIQWRTPVRAFVDSHSEKLSACLWGGKYSDADILKNIDKFEWHRFRYSPQSRKEKRANKYKIKTTGFVRARELDKKYDWGTVK